MRQLAHSLGVPGKIIRKAPSAGFWKGQTDEKELGFSYDQLDELLHLFLDKKYDFPKLVEAGFPPETVTAVFDRVKENQHKLQYPPLAVIPAAIRK